MLLADNVSRRIVANTCEYSSTILSRMKGSFSSDVENTLTEISLRKRKFEDGRCPCISKVVDFLSYWLICSLPSCS